MKMNYDCHTHRPIGKRVLFQVRFQNVTKQNYEQKIIRQNFKKRILFCTIERDDNIQNVEILTHYRSSTPY